MIPVGNYLLQMSCWLAAFWLVYTLVLKKETFFKFNRHFLNIGLVVALVMPLFPVSYPVQMVAQPLTAQVAPLNPAPSFETESKINYWMIVYILGALFFFARFFIQHFNLYLLRKKSKAVIVNSLKVYQLEKDTAPFSFFNQIYVSSKLSSSTELETVVTHEKVHIHERHWADLLLLEMVRTLQWFNPLIQLYRKAMMQNHEYLADSGTLEFGVSARTYRAVLVNQMLGLPVVSYANSFTFSNSTNRLKMMKKNKSNSIKRLKFLLILPLISIILVGFAKPKYVTESHVPVTLEETLKIKGKVMDKSGEALPGASIIVSNTHYGTVSDLKGEFILEAIKPNDKIVVSFVGYETKVFPVRAEKMTLIMEREVMQIEVGSTGIAPPPPPPASAIEFRSKNGKTPLIVVDGKISSIDVNDMDHESIESINVLKDKAAIDKYGKKGKDGVVEISTKKEELRISPEGETFFVVEDMPKYPGGPVALEQYFRNETADSKESGVVYVSFVVNHKGMVSNARVAKSTNKKLNVKALEIVNKLQKWEPGKQRGKPVQVDYTVPIEF